VDLVSGDGLKDTTNLQSGREGRKIKRHVSVGSNESRTTPTKATAIRENECIMNKMHNQSAQKFTSLQLQVHKVRVTSTMESVCSTQDP
jgi:hypothetical protein